MLPHLQEHRRADRALRVGHHPLQRQRPRRLRPDHRRDQRRRHPVHGLPQGRYDQVRGGRAPGPAGGREGEEDDDYRAGPEQGASEGAEGGVVVEIHPRRSSTGMEYPIGAP